MKLIATEKADQNLAPVDPWTVVHLAMGLAAGLMDLPRSVAFPAAVAYEIVEQYAERTDWGRDLLETQRPETLPNVAMDLAVFAAGQWMGERWNARGG